MQKENKSKNRIINLFKGKGMYIIAGLCFLAIGAIAWSGVQVIKDANEHDRLDIISSEEGLPENELAESLPEAETNDLEISETHEEPKKPSNKPEKQPELKTEETSAPVASFFVNPVSGKIIKDFSDSQLQYSMTYNDLRLHLGVDIEAKSGTPVIAAGEGTIIKVYSDELYGGVVEIDHGKGITAKYCGLNNEPAVKEGQRVDSSVQIGDIASVPCESVEEPHLHLEFFNNGEPVSPMKYINK